LSIYIFYHFIFSVFDIFYFSANQSVDINCFYVYNFYTLPPHGMSRQKGEQLMINEKVKEDSMTRLKKIEGQIRGIMKMVDQEKYCIDIINQITAAEKALDGVAKNIMKRHIESCVTEAIIQGEGQTKIEELIETVFKISNRRNK